MTASRRELFMNNIKMFLRAIKGLMIASFYDDCSKGVIVVNN